MIKATARLKDGRVLLVLGLSEGNVQHMKAGRPIYFDIDALKLGPDDRLGVVTVFYGPDEATLTASIKSMIGPQTEVISVPKGDPRPQ
jgi:hypothetical protein